MRNLKLLNSRRIQTECLRDVSCMSVDYDTGLVYMASSTHLLALDPSTLQVTQQISLVDEGFAAKVIGLEHLPDQMSVCAATASGDVLLWNTLSNNLQCTGTVESGLQYMAWSPDQELLILATGSGTLVMMTREFDPLMEVPLTPTEFGEAQFITVGWGKKETQFHGSEGKKAALQKTEPVKPASEWDDRQVKISWRGDGQFFVVSSLDPNTGARILRVWTREFMLHATSESVDGVEHALAWKPSGSLIASAQRKLNKHDIIFFEKNGLKHGEFSLPFASQQVTVRETSWNLESTVLCVWCEETRRREDSVLNSYVQLWTTSNYHWYLKQSLCFECVSAVQWDVEHAYKMHIVCGGDQYLQYVWTWTTDQSTGLSKGDLTTVAVIDAEKLLLTPFKKTVVPPPMSAFQVQGPCAIHQVAFGVGSKSNEFSIMYCDDSLEIYSYNHLTDGVEDASVNSVEARGNGFKMQCSLPKCIARFCLSDVAGKAPYPLSLYHLTWISEERFIVIRKDAAGSASTVYLVAVDGNKPTLLETQNVDGQIFNTAFNPETGSVVLHLTDGSLLTFSADQPVIQPFTTPDGATVTLPQPCTQMAVTSISGEEVILGLTYRYRFYINDTEVATNCTSFVVHDEFLILTTHMHTCRFISKSTPLKDLKALPEEKSHPFDESIRRAERGSRAVCVVPYDTKLVLQMPRGNLEVIHPRALTLSAVRSHLNAVEFGKAFILMRKHRINMNLMYDHNPDMFINNVGKFIEQISSVNNINLFLTDLREEDVTQTMYTASYGQREAQTSTKGAGKINTVCDTLRQILEKSEQYLLSVLTCHVKKTKPELDLALMKIQDVQDKTKNRTDAEEALKYLLFLVDVNELYDVALGTYDFDLVIMVAEKSNKDPKEYLPFLNDLRKLDSEYKKYTIDKYLKKWSSALLHVSKCVDDHFDECLSLIKERRLYSEALKLFTKDSQHFKEIATAYGHYLADHKHYEEAGLMFSRAKAHEEALEVYQKALNWQHALCMAVALNRSDEQITQLSRSLAEKLKEHRMHEEASRLYLEYNEDTEEAIACLIEGAVWKEALRLMYKHKRLDLVETHLESAMTENYENLGSALESISADLTRYFMRLQTVRQEKERQRLELLEGEGEHNDADADLYSDASSATGESVRSSSTRTSTFSTASQRSKASGKSGKARRKAEKKKWSLREGSAHEDLALIEALSQLITKAENSKKEVENLLYVLVQFEHVSQAEELQGKMKELLNLIEQYVPDIWNDESFSASASTQTFGPESTANSIAQAVQQGKGVLTKVELDPVLRMAPTQNKIMRWHLHSLSKADN